MPQLQTNLNEVPGGIRGDKFPLKIAVLIGKKVDTSNCGLLTKL
jgi:hypothetical protein